MSLIAKPERGDGLHSSCTGSLRQGTEFANNIRPFFLTSDAGCKPREFGKENLLEVSK
jgi:hypothetical protein